MLDVQTHRKIRISTDGSAGPYIIVPDPQLRSLQAILEAHKVPHWAESGSVSLDGRPALAVINLGRGADVARIQAIIDRVDEES